MLGLGNLLTKSGVIKKFPNDFSFNFDGSNDYLEIDSSSAFDVGTGNFSVSAWINVTLGSGDTIKSILYSRNASDSSRGFDFHVDDGADRLRVNVSDGSGTEANGTTNGISSNTWHHVVMTVNRTSNELKLYIDGSLNKTQDISARTGSFSNTAEAYIGSRSSTLQNFDGFIDELALWHIELSASDVAKIASKPVDLTKYSASNLKLWLRVGDKAEPESNTAIARQDFYTDFDGTDDLVLIDDAGDIMGLGSNSYSISAWVKVADATNNQTYTYFSAGSGSSQPRFKLQVTTLSGTNSLKAVYEKSDSSHLTITCNTTIDTEWHHLAFVEESSTSRKFYQDGEIVPATSTVYSTGSSFTPDTTYVDYVIGANRTSSANQFLDGGVSSVSLYQTALDAQTISQMAKSRFTPMRDNRFSVVDFDGSDDYIDCGADVHDFSSGDFTISGWIFHDTANTAHAGIVGVRLNDGNSANTEVQLYVDKTNNTLASWNGSSNVNSTSAIPDEEWSHVSLVQSGSNKKFYINGILDNTVSQGNGNQLSTATFKIGWTGSVIAENFLGGISSISVYNVEKSAEEIYAIYQQGITYDESSLSGLVGYWRMGDDTSRAFATIADSSSNSNDGTIKNGASDDIVQQMVAGYDMGAFESSSQEELGGELITASLDTGSGITSSSYITYDGKMNINASGQDFYIQINNNADTSSPSFMYRLVVTVDSYTSGSMTMAGGSAGFVPFAISNSFNDIIVPDSNGGSFQFRVQNYVAVISSISLKRIISSPNLSDTHPAIIDVNEPVLGAELMGSDTDFTLSGTQSASTSGTYWVTGANWTISGGKAIYDDGGNTKLEVASSTFQDAGLYKFSFDISDASSGARIKLLAGSNELVASTTYQNGTNEVYFNKSSAFGSAKDLEIEGRTEAGTFKIDNVSVKKILGNVGTMTNQDSADLVYSSVLPDQSFLTGLNSAYNFVSLDGSNDYIKNESFTGHQQDTGTISIWVKFGDISGFQYITGVGGNTSTGTNRVITLSDENLRFSGYSADYDTGADVVADNWYHIVLIWNGTSVTFYLDGTAYTNTVSNLVTPTGTNFVVGAYPAGFGGKAHADFGTVAHWNKVLTSTEVNAIKDLGRHGNLLDSYSDNLKLCYSMSGLDAKTGFSDTATTIYDRSGNSNHGTTVSIASSDLKSSPNAQPEGYAKGDTNRSTTTP